MRKKVILLTKILRIPLTNPVCFDSGKNSATYLFGGYLKQLSEDTSTILQLSNGPDRKVQANQDVGSKRNQYKECPLVLKHVS